MASIERLARTLRGRVLTAEDTEYDAARRIWNGLIDKRPRMIAQCRGVSDVIETVRYANEEGLQIAVRAGGHGVAGHALIEDGIVIDLSALKGAVIERRAQTVWAQAGLLGAELDAEAQQLGLAVPLGTVSHTGISGLTLGGGYGWLSRRHGLACDNLLAAGLVTASGDYVEVDKGNDPDLFWAIRGGGGNFGIVTAYKYALHEVGPDVFGGYIIYPIASAKSVLDFYRAFTLECGDDVTIYLTFTHVGHALVCGLTLLSARGAADNARLSAQLRGLGTPIRDEIGTTRYSVLQRVLDNHVPHGANYYWRAGYMGNGALTDEAAATLLENVGRITSPKSIVSLEHVGGQINRVAPADTAFPHRNALYNLLICSAWSGNDGATSHMRYADDCWQAMTPHMLGKSLYQNYGGADPRAIYAGNYDRLARLKLERDPDHRLAGNTLFGGLYRQPTAR